MPTVYVIFLLLKELAVSGKDLKKCKNHRNVCAMDTKDCASKPSHGQGKDIHYAYYLLLFYIIISYNIKSTCLILWRCHQNSSGPSRHDVLWDLAPRRHKQILVTSKLQGRNAIDWTCLFSTCCRYSIEICYFRRCTWSATSSGSELALKSCWSLTREPLMSVGRDSTKDHSLKSTIFKSHVSSGNLTRRIKKVIWAVVGLQCSPRKTRK